MTTAALVSTYHPDFRDLYKGLQSHRVTSDLRQQMSLALERQLSGQLHSYASSLISIPLATQPALSTTTAALQTPFPSKTPGTKQHPPLAASNSVATCSAQQSGKTNKEHRKLDRSVSEPVDKSLRPAPPPNSSRYKTELCRPFEENGTCKYGDKCQFAHGIGELRTLSRHPKYKTELCRTFHSTGFCPYGPRCHFIHNSEDSKKCLMNTLKGGCIPSGHSPIHSSSSTVDKDYDFCSFSIGSAGDLSPTGSTSSSGGSPPSSLNGFYLDDNSHSASYQVPPHTAPPTMTNGVFFGSEYGLKPLSVVPPMVQEFESPVDDSMVSSLDMLMSDLDLNSPGDEPCSPAKEGSSPAIDINRNIIRLPIFSRISLGSTP